MANASSFSGQLTFLQKGRTKDKSQDKEIATCERQVAPIGLILWSMQSGSMRAEKRMPQKGGGKGSKGHEKRMKSGWDCGKCCCCCNRVLLCVDSMGLRPAVVSIWNWKVKYKKNVYYKILKWTTAKRLFLLRPWLKITNICQHLFGHSGF